MEIKNSAQMIFQVNVWSIKKYFDQLEIFINTIVDNPDIVMCYEAWIKEIN